MARILFFVLALFPACLFAQETKLAPLQLKDGTAPDQILLTQGDNTWAADLLSNHAAAPFTVLNGLYLDVDEVKMGGALTESTNVDGGSAFSMTFTNLTTFSAAGSEGTLSLDGTGISAVIGAGATNGFEVTDLNSTGGIRYTAEYWSSYTDRSLIDRGYLLDLLSQKGDTLTSLSYGNSISLGTDDSTDIGGFEVNTRHFSFDNQIWDFDVAIADTAGYGYTNIPRRFFGDTLGCNCGPERVPRHGNLNFWLSREHVLRNPLNYSFSVVAGRGGILVDSLTKPPMLDSLGAVIDSAAARGVDYYDVVSFGAGAQETNPEFAAEMIKFWEWLRDDKGVVDENTIFLIPAYKNPSLGEDINVAIMGLGSGGRPNFKVVDEGQDMTFVDAVHPSAAGHKRIGVSGYYTYLGGAREVSMDTLMNWSAGPTATRGMDSEGTFFFIPNVLDSSVDSLRSTMAISLTSDLEFVNYCKQCLVIGDSNYYQRPLNAVDTVVVIGFNNLYGTDVIRDATIVFGYNNEDNKGGMVFGRGNEVNKVGGMIFGANQTTTRNNELMLGSPTTDFVMLGSYPFDMSTALGPSVDGFGFVYDDPSGDFILTDLSGAGSSSLIVEELDGAPSASAVTEINFDQGAGFTVTDNGSGSVTVSGGFGDNLGDHNATTLLNLNGNAIQDVSFVLFDDSNADTNDWSFGEDGTDGVLEIELDFTRVFLFNEDGSWGNTNYILPAADGSANQVLQTNGAGVVTWATVGGGSGDNLGDHTATQTINASGELIDSLSILQFLDADANTTYWALLEKGTTGNFWIQSSDSGTPDLEITAAGAVTFGGTTFPISTGTTDQVLTLTSAGTADWQDVTASAGTTENYFAAYDSTTTAITSGSWQDVTLDIEVQTDATYFSHSAGSAEVTFDSAGVYAIHFVGNAESPSRSDGYINLSEKPSGGSYSISWTGKFPLVFDVGAGIRDVSSAGFWTVDVSAGHSVKLQVLAEDAGWNYKKTAIRIIRMD